MYGRFSASTLGHELMHGFGGIPNWRDQKSLKEYEKKADCVVKQYNSFIFNIDGTNYTTNGTSSLRENLADNDGIKIGYRY